jgi:DNA-binding NtrC family response regulator
MAKARVLVVDDDQIVLDSVRQVLTDENYDVDVTLRGREGLELAIRKDYDIVFIDIRMPDIGGIRVLRCIKRKRPALPVVIITGYATTPSVVMARELGAADFIEKPFEPQELLKTGASALQTARTPSRGAGRYSQGNDDQGS